MALSPAVEPFLLHTTLQSRKGRSHARIWAESLSLKLLRQALLRGPGDHLKEAITPSGTSHLHSHVVLRLRESVVCVAKSLTGHLTSGKSLNLAKPQFSLSIKLE